MAQACMPFLAHKIPDVFGQCIFDKSEYEKISDHRAECSKERGGKDGAILGNTHEDNHSWRGRKRGSKKKAGNEAVYKFYIFRECQELPQEAAHDQRHRDEDTQGD